MLGNQPRQEVDPKGDVACLVLHHFADALHQTGHHLTPFIGRKEAVVARLCRPRHTHHPRTTSAFTPLEAPISSTQ